MWWAIALVCGCAGTAPPPADWIAWRSTRLESVAGTNGWTTLIGLHWLGEGTNSAGSATTQDVVVAAPGVPEMLGWFIRQGDVVRFVAAPGADVRSGGAPVTEIPLVTDRDPTPTVLEAGSARLLVIARGDRLGVRIRSAEAPARRGFPGLRCFPYDPAWRKPARFEPFPTARTLQLPSVIGIPQAYVSPGRVVFTQAGQEYALDVVIEPGESDYFVLFRDATAAGDTYASGRFLHVTPPNASGRTVVDFNRAYTPPCGFTAFATCPLPPPQNRLPFPIPAGERRPGTHPVDPDSGAPP